MTRCARALWSSRLCEPLTTGWLRRSLSQIPAQSETNGIGAQIPTEKYGVISPFHAGGGGGGGGGGSGAAEGATTQVFVGGSNTVPAPHSAALPTPGEMAVTKASGATAPAMMLAKR
jgi:hypothetical protein